MVSEGFMNVFSFQPRRKSWKLTNETGPNSLCFGGVFLCLWSSNEQQQCTTEPCRRASPATSLRQHPALHRRRRSTMFSMAPRDGSTTFSATHYERPASFSRLIVLHPQPPPSQLQPQPETSHNPTRCCNLWTIWRSNLRLCRQAACR